jgi:hypothetical protein
MDIELRTPAGAPAQFQVEIDGAAPHDRSRALTIAGRLYPLTDTRHVDYLDLFERLAADLGLRVPLARMAADLPTEGPPLRAILTTPLSPDILYGYGDPCVIRTLDEDGRPVWFLLVTSNDAPDAFPILRSEDLFDWRPAGFVFPRGHTPAWTLTGENQADFWRRRCIVWARSIGSVSPPAATTTPWRSALRGRSGRTGLSRPEKSPC